MKKSILVLCLSFLVSSNQFPQILNPGFENWTNEDPDGWDTFDNGSLNAVTQSNDAHSDNSAARLEIIENGTGGPFGPWLESGEAQEGFTVSERYLSLTGFYKFSPVGNDVIAVIVEMIAGPNLIGIGDTLISNTSSSYAQFFVSISYSGPETPDKARISIFVSDSSSGGMLNIGSVALIDDLSFGDQTDVKIENGNPSSFNLTQNYPNPFNPSTKINFSITEQTYVELIVYDLLGREIEKLVSDNYPAGDYSVDFSADNLPGGIYFAKMSAGKYSKAIKMTLLK